MDESPNESMNGFLLGPDVVLFLESDLFVADVFGNFPDAFVLLKLRLLELVLANSSTNNP